MLPRGYSWELDGMKFVSFGGAPSIDYPHRSLGRDWWQEEMIRETDLARLERSVGADVMICHDSPDGGTTAVQEIIDTPPHKSFWSESGLAYAREGRMLMNRAVEIVKPKIFVHGHYHVADHRFDWDQRRWYVSLNLDGESGNIMLLDTEKQEMRWLD